MEGPYRVHDPWTVLRDPLKAFSRLELIQKTVGQAERPEGAVLNLGCKDTRIGNINVDISGFPDIRASALFLPFREGAFSMVIFSEVLEHLPRGMESQALGEICRVMVHGGVLVLSTPSAQGFLGKIYWLADPTFWLINHRHYTEAHLRRLLSDSHFRIEQLTMRGGPRDMVFNFITPLVSLLGTLGHPTYPDLNSDYSAERGKQGYDIIVQARKPLSKELPLAQFYD